MMMRKFKRALKRGVTLVEILIVLAIVGLIAGGVAIYAVPKFKEGQIKTAHNNGKLLQPIADAWRAGHQNECPTIQRLKEEREVAATTDINDPWGHPYQIRCDDKDTIIVSWGPDGKEGTQDDIHEPDVPTEAK